MCLFKYHVILNREWKCEMQHYQIEQKLTGKQRHRLTLSHTAFASNWRAVTKCETVKTVISARRLAGLITRGEYS